MANVLGQIIVELQANVGGFVSGMSKAAVEAQKASKEISHQFRDLGEVAAQTFGPFGEQLNPIISKLSFVLSSAGSAASQMMKEFGKVGGAIGPLASLGAGAAVGMAALGATMIGVAMHSAEAAEKLLQLSRSTGVPVEQLSALGFAARQTGIDQEQLVKSLQLLSANMVKAAEAPKGTATAFSRLRLEIHQGNGDLKNAASFMGEVIAKLSEMRDKTAAVGEARQLMGRGGAAILQLGDPEEIEHWIEMAQKLGVVIDTQTAVAAEHFEQTLGLLRGAAEGTANRMMADLLPALQAVADEFAKSALDPSNSFGKDLIKTIEWAIKGGIAVAQTWVTAFEQIGAAIRHAGADILNLIDFVKGAGPLVADVLSGNIAAAAVDFGTAKNAWRDFLNGTKANIELFNDESKRLWKDNSDFIENVTGPRAPWTTHGGGGSADNGLKPPPGPGAGGRPDVVAELVAKLEAQAAAELQLASATEKSAAATVLAKAAAEADAKVAETRAHLLEREKELRERLASEPDSKHAPTLQAEIFDVRKMLAELEKSAPQIKALYTEIASAGFAVHASQELEKFTVKTDEETAALERMAAAFNQGPAAVQRAQESAKIAPFEQQRASLGQLLDAARNPAQGVAKLPDADVAQLQKAYDQLGAAIDRAKASVAAFTAAEISEKIAKEKEQLQAEAKAYGIVAAAALKSAAEQREAAAQAAVIKFSAEHPSATSAELAGVRDLELAKLDEEREKTVALESVQYSLNAAYGQELEKLQEIRAFLASSGESTIAIDTKIYETQIQHLLDYRKQVFESQNEELLGEQKIYEQSVQLTEQWDRAALAVGSIAEKWRAVLNRIELEGQNFGGKIFEQIGKSIDDVSGELAKFIVTGKSSFQKMVDSWAESLLKLSFQKTFSFILGKIFGGPQQPGQNGQGQTPAGGTPPFLPAQGGGLGGVLGAIGGIFGIKTPGTSGPDGSQARPFYVIDAGAAGAAGGTSTGNPASALSGLGSLPLVGPAFKGASSVIGPISSIFGGGASSSGTPGGGGPDGSQDDPLYVISMSDSSGGGGLSGLLSGMGGDSSGGGGGGGGLADILSGFFMADGGRVTSGVPYVVGEKNAEVFVPDQPGRIVPSLAAFAKMPESRAMKLTANFAGISRRESGGPVLAGHPYLTGEARPEVYVPDRSSSSTRSSGPGNAQHAEFHFHLNGVKDYDSFRRSESQMYGEAQRQAAIHFHRNHG